MESESPDLHPAIVSELARLFYAYSPGQISYHLRKMLVCFVLHEKDVPGYYGDLVNNIDFLLDFLELADHLGVPTDTNRAHLPDLDTSEDTQHSPFTGNPKIRTRKSSLVTPNS